MANEIRFSTATDLVLVRTLTQEISLLLADRADLWGHPAITYVGDLAGSGSTARDVALAGLDGYDLMAAVAEGSGPSNTQLTDASPAITIARQALQRELSGILESVESVGLTVPRLAQDMVGAAGMRFTEMVANVADDFTSTVGSTTVDLSVDDFFDAQFTLTQASVDSPYLALLYPVQLTDLQNSVRAEAGALQYIAATQDMLSIKGQGFAGSFNGVDIFTSSKVPTANAGADSAGGMWGYGAIGYADGTRAPVEGPSGTIYPSGTKLWVALDYNTNTDETVIVGNYYVGVAILEDGRGVAIITDR